MSSDKEFESLLHKGIKDSLGDMKSRLISIQYQQTNLGQLKEQIRLLEVISLMLEELYQYPPEDAKIREEIYLQMLSNFLKEERKQ